MHGHAVLNGFTNIMEKLSLESGEHYFKCLEVLKENCGELVKNKAILHNNLPTVIQRTLQNSRPQFNVLSVSSADETVDFAVLKIVDAELGRDTKYQHMKVFNRAIESNREHISIYKEAIQSLPNSLKSKTSFDFCERTFEEYMKEPSKDPATKFDLVHFYHSIYYLDIEQTLKHCLEKELQENGHVIVVLDGTGDLLGSILSASERENPELGSKEPVESPTPADRVIEVAVKNGWKYEIVPQECVLDVTEVFDEHSIKGNLLLDFMTHFKDFRTTAGKAHVEKVLSVIRDETVEKDGKRVGNNNDVFIVISK